MTDGKSPRITSTSTPATPPGPGTVLYLLRFVPTYVAAELGELARRGVGLRLVVSAPWPRARLWEEITGFARAGGRGIDTVTVDAHAWLTAPVPTLVRRAPPVLLGLVRRRGRRALAVLGRALAEGTLRHALVAAWLDRALADRPFDRVHAHFATDAATTGLALATLAGVPFTVTTHAADIFVPTSPRRLGRLLRRADGVLTISAFNRAHLARTVGCDVAERTRVVPLGVDTAALPAWSPPAGEVVVGCTASGLGDKKGLGVLLDACEVLRARGLAFRCRITGADPGSVRLDALRATVRRRGLTGTVECLGARPWAEAQALVAGSTLFVHPSRATAAGDMDGIPVSLMEAMAIGVPVVATRLSGIPELVVDGESGWLVAPDDAMALADCIARVVADPAAAARVGRRGRVRVRQHFDLAHAVDGLLAAWGTTPRTCPPTNVRAASGGVAR